jgi:hypothetical protein
LNGVGGRGVKCSGSRFGAALDGERKVAGKRTYLTAVVVAAPSRLRLCVGTPMVASRLND